MRTSWFAAAAAVAVSSAAQAGFVVSSNVEFLGTSFTLPAGGTPPALTFNDGAQLVAYNIYARNTGGDTGAGILAFSLAASGVPTLWTTNVSGTPNITNFNTATGQRWGAVRSFITLEGSSSSPGFFNETLSQTSRTPQGSWGSAGTGSLRTGIVDQFAVGAFGDAPVADASLNGGRGLLVARIIGPAGGLNYQITASGTTGAPVSLSGSSQIADLPLHTLRFTDTNVVTVNINSASSFAPKQLTAEIRTGLPTGETPPPPTLTAGSIDPLIADNLSITGDFTDGPLSISGSGFTAADVGSYTVPFTLSYSGAQTRGYFVLNVVPEPTSLLTAASAAGFALHRRRRP